MQSNSSDSSKISPQRQSIRQITPFKLVNVKPFGVLGTIPINAARWNLEVELTTHKVAERVLQPSIQHVHAMSPAKMSTDLQPTYLKVANEGANLHVWYQGTGPLLILIQGGGGDGARFNAAIPTLSKHYTTVAYDRRGNAESTVTRPSPLNPVQSARDVVAIMKALGFSKTSVFGTSSGGIIALQLAASYPEYLEHVVIHEVPTLSLLTGEKTDRMDEAYVAYETFREMGAEAALEVFRASGAGNMDPQLKHTYADLPLKPQTGALRSRHRLDYFFAYEFIVFHTYTPPFAQVRANDVSVAAVEGSESGDKFYARVTQIQADAMGCAHVVWPGGHAIFVAQPEEFAKSLRETLVMLDGRK